jgi:hypothetical protein
MRALLGAPTNRMQGFLAAGHVCTVMGYEEYEPIAAHYRVPIVVTGFEPLDILEGVYMCVCQLEQGRGEVGVPPRLAPVGKQAPPTPSCSLIRELRFNTFRVSGSSSPRAHGSSSIAAAAAVR